MALQKQIIDFPLTGGMDGHTDQLILDKSKCTKLVNATFNPVVPWSLGSNLGIIQGDVGTISRREGWQDIQATIGGHSWIELATYGNELLAIDAPGTLNSYAPDKGPGGLSGKGPISVPYFSLSKDRIRKTLGLQQAVDCATSSGLTLYAWLDYSQFGATQQLLYSVVDDATGTKIVDGAQLVGASSTLTAPRVCVGTLSGGGNAFFVFWNDNGTGKIQSFAVVNLSASLVTTVVSDVYTAGGGPRYDLANVNGIATLVYASTNASDCVRGVCFNELGIIGSINQVIPTTHIATGGTTTLSLTSFGNTLAGVVAGTTGASVSTAVVLVASSSSGLTLSVSFQDQAISAAAVTISATLVGSNLQVFCCPTFAGGTGLFKWSTFSMTSGNVTSGRSDFLNSIQVSSGITGPNMAGKAFTSNGAAYVPTYIFVNSTTGLQSGMYVVDTSGNVQAMAMYGVYANPTQNGFVPSTTTLSGVYSGDISIPAFELGTLSFSSGVNTTQQGISRIRLTYGRTTSHSFLTPLWHAQAGRNIFFSGAFLAMYDGSQVAEAGFFWFPEGVTAVAGAAGSPNGTYSVVALYEWVDAQGQRHQSAPSPAQSVTVTSAKIVMTAPTLQLGVRKACTVVFYRTVAGGTTYYRDTPITAPVNNSGATATVSYTSNVTDAALLGNEALYTTGGALPNNCPAACRAIASYQKRLVFNLSEDPQAWGFSQAPVQGVGLYFNETLLGGRTLPENGPVNALGSIDDKLIIYTPTRKHWATGQFPDPTGANITAPDTLLLTSDAGCIDQRSICNLPDVSATVGRAELYNQGGQTHQSKRGLVLLDRGLVDRDIGFPIQSEITSPNIINPISSAVVMQDRGQARFTLTNSANSFTLTGPAEVLVFDFMLGQWSIFYSFNLTPLGGVIWNGQFTFCDTKNGAIAQEVPGQYVDVFNLSSTWYTMTVVTPWFRAANIQGFQRFLRVLFAGNFFAGTSFSASAYYNYNENATAGSTTSFLSSQLSTGNVWQLRWKPAQQKGESMQLVITDTATGFNYGLGLSSIQLEVGVKKGSMKLPAGQSN